jgi:hypothetical protein
LDCRERLGVLLCGGLQPLWRSQAWDLTSDEALDLAGHATRVPYQTDKPRCRADDHGYFRAGHELAISAPPA